MNAIIFYKFVWHLLGVFYWSEACYYFKKAIFTPVYPYVFITTTNYLHGYQSYKPPLVTCKLNSIASLTRVNIWCARDGIIHFTTEVKFFILKLNVVLQLDIWIFWLTTEEYIWNCGKIRTFLNQRKYGNLRGSI